MLSRASVAENMDMATRGPMLRMLRPAGDIRMHVSIAVRYKSGSRFLVHGSEGRSGRGFCTGASGEDRLGRGALRRDVRIRIWDDDALGRGIGVEWKLGVREGAALRLRMRASYCPMTRLSTGVNDFAGPPRP